MSTLASGALGSDAQQMTENLRLLKEESEKVREIFISYRVVFFTSPIFLLSCQQEVMEDAHVMHHHDDPNSGN
jgi:hypothetical protein